MEKIESYEQPLDELPPVIPFRILILLFVAVGLGTLAAALVLPGWLPGLSASLLGPAPKAYWYLARASAFVAYVLLWLSIILGLLMTNKLARIWPGGPVAFDLHQYTSLLGLAFALFHALILLGDSYIDYSLVHVLVPFAGVSYAPVWVGLGQLSFYLLAIVGLSFYARKQLGRQAWRFIHYLSFAIFLLVLIHGIGSGTDSAEGWTRVLYSVSGGSVLFLTIYRILQCTVVEGTPSQRAHLR